MMSNQTIEIDKGAVPAPVQAGILWIGLALAGMASFYWIGLVSLLDAWSLPEYSHGYLIAPIALFLLLRQLGNEDPARALRPPRRGLGIAVIVFGLAVGLIGNLVNIPDISTYGLIVCIAGLLLVVMGTGRGLMFWAPVAYLVFMLPLPNFIYWPLSIKLQMISSVVGVEMIRLFGIPVFLDGNVIDLGVYKLQVAEACSGLRYLFPLASFGFLFAVLYRGPFWHRALLFLSAMPITVLMNCVRIAIIGVLVDRYGIAQAEGFLHFFEGWIIFIACIAVLYLEAFLLQRLVKHPQPVHGMLDIDFASLAEAAGRVWKIQASRVLILSATAILLAGLAWQLAPARASVAPQRDPLVLFPVELGDWRGGSQRRLDPDIERVLKADDYLDVDFVAEGAGSRVNLFIAYYKSQTEGSGIHSPEVCIPAGGWEVSRWTTADTGIATASGAPLTVNRAIIQKGLSRQLVYYWFEQRGRQLTGDYAAKAYTVWDSMARGRTDGALVRVVTPIGQTEPMEAADGRLRGFLKLALARLPNFVPH